MNKRLGRLLRPGMLQYFIVLFAFAVLALLYDNYVLAGIELGIAALLLGIHLLDKQNRRRKLHNYIKKVTNLDPGTQNAESPFPTLLLRLGDNAVIYVNDAFVSATNFSDTMSERLIEDIIPGFHTDWLASGKHEYPYDVTLGNHRYRIYGTTVKADDPSHTLLGVLYFTDLTGLYQIRDEYIRSRPVVSIILVDNYEELTKNLSESAIATLNARLNDAIMQWTENYRGLLRKLEKNRYLFIFEKRDLKAATEDKFSLLEDINEVTNPSGLAASISFGIGVDGSSFEESYNFAALAIEMALSRGGDQAVIKDRYDFSFYGGGTKEADNRSKVRSRVMANSFLELVSQSSEIFVMGHKNADLDAVGAAVGICCLCRKKGKHARIVMDLERNASKELIEMIRAVPQYQDVFISGQEALLLCDPHSILVVVDTNRPDQVEFRPLLETISRVCVVDHHRRAADYIDPVVLNLHAPYASSASELVTELLQYGVEKEDLLPIEVKALMAGIFLDTKSFNVRTGERTFEAAAFLRQMGADPVEVKKLLQNDFQDTMAKYQIIKSARLYRNEIAISALNAPTNRVLAAQAADELLNISGITASFVMYPDGDQVILSARSIGSANVQFILEPLGGGGNAATAGAQIKNSTVKDALDRLVVSIDNFYERKEESK